VYNEGACVSHIGERGCGDGGVGGFDCGCLIGGLTVAVTAGGGRGRGGKAAAVGCGGLATAAAISTSTSTATAAAAACVVLLLGSHIGITTVSASN
jgi:hypothetical protein